MGRRRERPRYYDLTKEPPPRSAEEIARSALDADVDEALQRAQQHYMQMPPAEAKHEPAPPRELTEKQRRWIRMLDDPRIVPPRRR
jgi:hypothetical protein